MTFFLLIDHKFRISPPIFAVSVHFPPVSRNLFFAPYFYKFPPPVLGKFTCCLHTLRVFPPYFDHDAFMHHPMHVLDAPGNTLYITTLTLSRISRRYPGISPPDITPDIPSKTVRSF